jgi:glycosyltransferase involved in cell wall biosynthesis
MPKLSIITVNLNNAFGLQKTMESVFRQTFTDYEYIIIDGGSIDGSKPIIEKCAKRLSFWMSEKDNGIYSAMNKGIANANGAYLLFLNSGDYFYSDGSLLKFFDKSNNEEIIYGNLLVNEEDGKQWVFNFPSALTFGFFYRSSLPHQGTIIKKNLFEKIGLYNENLKVAADWEFFIKAICFYNCTYLHVNEIISMFHMGGISTKPEFSELTTNERQKVLNRSYSAFVDEYEEYFQMKAELNNYKNSRAHQFIEKIIKSRFYNKIK